MWFPLLYSRALVIYYSLDLDEMGCVQFKVVWPWTPVLLRFWHLLHPAANSISSRNLSTRLVAKWTLLLCLLPGGGFLGHRML